MGFAQISGKDEQAILHLQETTRMPEEAVKQHVADAFTTWMQRSQYMWSIDLSILTKNVITVNEMQTQVTRAEISISTKTSGHYDKMFLLFFETRTNQIRDWTSTPEKTTCINM